MPLAFSKNESHPMVDALLRTRVPRWQELNRAIDERDDMLDFAIGLFDHDRDRALTSYFQNGLEQYALVRHIAGWRGGAKRMLDFASGYGRLTRFLVHEKLAEEVTVSDILEDGMAFQSEQFGVRTIVSKTNPEELAAPERYDLIFVASLFTHLPAATFTRWLRRLAGLLTPSGLLIFSVHDQSLAPAPVDGILFHAFSESRVLDVEEYGSTWVTEEYVRAQVAAIGDGFACVRLPRALADWQDVYVISPSPIPDAKPRRTPKGFVDQVSVSDEGIRVSGWASAVSEDADRVEIRLEDRLVASTRNFEPRPDVAAWLGAPSGINSGWLCVIPHDEIRSFRYEVATISAFTREGEERILFLGPLDSLRGHVAREKAKDLERLILEERRAHDEEIATMKQSRFWKAREQWFAFKRALRITEER